MSLPDSRSGGMLLRIILLLLGAALSLHAQQRTPVVAAGLRFEENLGQVFDMEGKARRDILFTASSGGVTLFLRKSGISYVFAGRESSVEGRGSIFPELAPGSVQGYRLDMDLVGANPDPVIERGDPSSDYSNYYISSLPDGITGVRFYRQLTYRDIYPNIDMVLRATDSGMKYDFLVRPGGRVADIRLRHTAADSVVLTDGGDAVIATPFGHVSEQAPFCFVQPEGTQRSGSAAANPEADEVVPSRYRLENGILSLEIGSYDRTRTLVIDPVRMWSTYLGGSNHDYAAGGNPIAIDAEENVLVTGLGQNPDFPVSPGAFQGSTAIQTFVAKMDPRGNRVWATMFGGPNPALHIGIGHAIVTDPGLNVYFGGFAWGGGFPTTADAYQRDPSGGYDGYLAKLDRNGNRVWATYYGGSGDEAVFGLAIDGNSDLIVAASTSSSGMGTFGTFQPNRPADLTDKALIAKFGSNGRRIWATYCGGSSDDHGFAVAVDSRRNIVVTGWTTSSDFPVSPGAHQMSLSGFADAFILKLDPTGNRLWATYYGGAGIENHSSALGNGSATPPLGNPNSAFCAITVDPSDAVLITGITTGSFPTTANAPQTTFGGSPNDAFVAKFDSDGGRLWSTYLGGNSFDGGTGIACRQDGSVLVTGFTYSTNLPVTNDAIQGSNGGLLDLLIARYSSSGALDWSSYYGGVAHDLGRGIACHPHGPFAVTGYTIYGGYPVTPGAFQTQTSNPNTFDAVLALFCDPVKPSLTAAAIRTICHGDSLRISGPAGYDSYLWNNGATTREIFAKQSGSYTLRATGRSGCSALSDPVQVTIRPRRQPVVVPSGPTRICTGESLRLDVTETFSSYEWSNGLRTPSILVNREGLYRVVTIDENGCRDSSETIEVFVRPRPVLVLSAGTIATICEGDSIVIFPMADFSSYRWSTGETTSSKTVRATGDYTLTVTDENGCEASATIGVTVTPRPNLRIALSGARTLCEGDTITLQVPAGLSSYRWSTGERGNSIRVHEAGRYSVVATAESSCEGKSDTVEITLVPAPRASITGPSSICPLSSATYSVVEQPGKRYQWSVEGAGGSITGSDIGPSAVVLWGSGGTGSVRVRVTDPASGCSSEALVDVTIGNSLVPAVAADGPTELCDGATVTLDAGPGYSSYLWNTGATTRSILVNTPGPYSVTVEDASGCSGSSLPVSVTRNVAPRPEIGFIGSPRLCPGESVVLDAGEYSSYRWSNGATVRQITVTEPGDYTVTVADAAGCEGSTTLALQLQPAPGPLIDGPGSVCINSTATYCVPDTTGNVYYWSVAGGTIVSGAGTPCITVQWHGAGAGAIDLRQISGTTGCSGDARQHEVSIGTSLSPTITPSRSTRLCEGETITLSAPSGYTSYLWNTGEQGRAITVDTAGSYSVTVVADGGCTGSAEVEVTMSPRPVATITPAGSLLLCEGDSTTLQAPPGFAGYRWSTGERSESITVREAGTYDLEVTDAGGCTGRSEQVIVTINPAPATPTVTTSGDTLFSSPALFYQWLLDGDPIAGATERFHVPPAPGAYTVRITDANGCSATSGGSASSTLSLSDIEATPGERITMPLELQFSQNLDALGLDRFSATIRFDRTLLLPIGSTPIGAIDGDDRVVTISGSRQRGATTGPVATLEFLVTLGGSAQTAVHIESFRWEDGSADVRLRDGSVRIIQNDGCERFIVVGSELLKITPNPASGLTEIFFQSIESGPTVLELIDLLGRPAATLLQTERKAEPGSIIFDTSDLPAGTYYLILRTPNTRAVHQMIIAR